MGDAFIDALLPAGEISVLDDQLLEWVGERLATDVPTLTEAALHRAQQLSAGEVQAMDLAEEICEQGEWTEVPFIRINGEAKMVHPFLFWRHTETLLYDRLRGLKDAQVHFSDFGKVFENYVGDALRKVHGTVIDENALRIRLKKVAGRDPEQLSCVDFAVDTEDSLVLVEVKSGKSQYAALNGVDQVKIANAMAPIEIAAIHQAMNTMELLPDDLKRPSTFFVCVTMKETLTGRGHFLRAVTSKDPVWERTEAFPELPPERYSFLSIGTLELVLTRCVAEGATFSDVLQRLVARGPAAASIESVFHGTPAITRAWPEVVIEATGKLFRGELP